MKNFKQYLIEAQPFSSYIKKDPNLRDSFLQVYAREYGIEPDPKEISHYLFTFESDLKSIIEETYTNVMETQNQEDDVDLSSFIESYFVWIYNQIRK